MPLDTLIFDPTPCGYPKPRIPPLPVGFVGLSLRAAPPWAPAAHFRHFSRGRYALAAAYRQAGIGPGTALLAPAYHCRTMLDPALALGGEVLLYPLLPDLSPDLAALDRLQQKAQAPIKALLACHFFGFPQDFAVLAEWCAQRRITLVEDASHVFFGEQYCPRGIGMFGAFVVSSPYKFLPSPDGGLLYARDPAQLSGIAPSAPSWREEWRGLRHIVQKSLPRPRLPDLDPTLAGILANPSMPAQERRELTSFSADYTPGQEDIASLRCSRTIHRHPDIPLVVERRRAHYRRWTTATMNLPYCRPLYPELPDGVVPYMFPLLLERPEPFFSRLKRLGVPIYRWDSLALSPCPTANDYRLRLLHLPCHQALTPAELDWMSEAIRKVGAGGAASCAAVST